MLARRANRTAPFDQLVLELLAPSLRLASSVRERIMPPISYNTLPMTAVGLERLREVEAENQQLRATLGLRDRCPTRGIVVEVIGRNSVPWEGNLIVGKGAADGVEAHMVAVTTDGVLGQVSAVSPHLAKIMPLTVPPAVSRL